jgi:hypothetical protein
MSGKRIKHKLSTVTGNIMKRVTQNKRGRQVTATSSFASGERGIREGHFLQVLASAQLGTQAISA